jgi:excisionase family DNA binding protein
MEKVLTPEEAAEALSVSVFTIKKWLRAGKLKGVKVGRVWRIRERDIAEFLDESQKRLEEKMKRGVNGK